MAGKPGGRSKLRRGRDFDGEGSIRSRLPSVEAPASRIVRADEAGGEVEGLLDLRGSRGALDVDEVVGRILLGDAAEALSRLPGDFVACAVTSPPYWNLVDYGYEGQIGLASYEAYLEDLTEVWRELARVLRPNGKLCIDVPLMPLRKDVSAKHFGASHTRYLLDLHGDLKERILRETGLIFYSLYIWEKQTTEKMFGSYPFPPNLYERNYVEFIGVFVKPGAPPKLPAAVKERARLTSAQWMELTAQILWMYPENVGRKRGHPAPFPEALPNRLLNMYSFPAVPEEGFPGDVILDPFCGWGTSCVAAKRCGRRYVGIDLSESFCREAARRCAATSLDPVVLPARRPGAEA